MTSVSSAGAQSGTGATDGESASDPPGPGSPSGDGSAPSPRPGADTGPRGRPDRPPGGDDDGPDPDDGAPAGTLERRLRAVAGLVAPTTILTALMVYFGYVSLYSRFAYFGIDLGILRLSNQDFLLNSVAALFLPIGSLLVVGVAALWSHTFLDTLVRSGRHARAVRVGTLTAAGLGLAIFARGMVGILVPDVAANEPIAVSPLCLGVGAVVVAYGRRLWLRAAGRSRRRDSDGRVETGAFLLVSGIVVLSLFWAVNSLAAAYGRGEAVRISSDLDSRPGVVLDTKERLDVQLDGLHETPLSDETFKYRYTGLRLLVVSGGRLFLLPKDWTNERGATIVVPDDDVRLLLFSP